MIHKWAHGIVFLVASTASATSVPSLTFEELTDRSEFIVAGQVTRSWSDWDSEHKYIWTHYEVSVSSAEKGLPGSTVIVSEPGGTAGDRGMVIAGSVQYRPGDRVAVFLERMPNGYLRTAGWGQGKYTVDQSGRLHPEMPQRGLEIVQMDQKPTAARGTSLRALDGAGIAELRARVSARIGTTRQGRTQ